MVAALRQYKPIGPMRARGGSVWNLRRIAAVSLSFVLTAAGTLCGGGDNPWEIRYARWVAAPSGLVMRATPSRTGKSLSVIPFGESVGVFYETGSAETIEGKPGQWSYVAYAPHRGFVSGGFLSTTPAPPARPSSADQAILDRLSQLSGIAIPAIPVRDAQIAGPTIEAYEPDRFSVYARKTHENIQIVSIQPTEHGCGWQGGYFDCFSIIGTTSGNYLYSDIASASIGPIADLTAERALFAQSEAHGDVCSLAGSGNAAVYLRSEFKVIRAEWAGGESCPCTCAGESAGGCQCPTKRYHEIRYYFRGVQLKPTGELERLFADPRTNPR
jgi:hypothetical protein